MSLSEAIKPVSAWASVPLETWAQFAQPQPGEVLRKGQVVVPQSATHGPETKFC